MKKVLASLILSVLPMFALTTSTPFINYIYYDAPDFRDEASEYIEIKNTSGVSVNLSGYVIYADDYGQDATIGNFTLANNKTCRVYTNKIDKYSCGSVTFGRGSAVWNNDGDAGCLYNPSGALISSYTYLDPNKTCPTTYFAD